jgi:hypothetical protein
MELAPGGKHKYSFAVIAGMNAGEPLSMRAARMKNYNQLVRELDSSGAHYSQELSEVDLSDPEDVKVLAADANGEALVHLGSGNYLQRYKTYVTHVQQWRQQFEKLESVDLRYDGQIIVNPDLGGMARQPALTPAATKAAMAAGVKTAAIVNYEKYVTHPAPAIPLKKEAKPSAKAGTKASIHHATAAHAPVGHVETEGECGAGRGCKEFRGVASGSVTGKVAGSVTGSDHSAGRGWQRTKETERWNSEGDSAELAIYYAERYLCRIMSPISLPPLT